MVKQEQMLNALFSRSGFDEKVLAEAESNPCIQLFDLSQIVNYR